MVGEASETLNSTGLKSQKEKLQRSVESVQPGGNAVVHRGFSQNIKFTQVPFNNMQLHYIYVYICVFMSSLGAQHAVLLREHVSAGAALP